MIFDSHAHYDDEAFDKDRDRLLSTLEEQGVGCIVNVGASFQGAKDSVELSMRYPHVYAAVGVHPDHVGELDEAKMQQLREMCAMKKTVAVGEHAGTTGGVIHCFSGSKEMAKEYIKMGYYIGVGGVVTFKNARVLKEVVESIPLERILTETDCPYLAPVPFRGKRNCSAYISYVLDMIAELKGVSREEAEQVTYENARNMYRITD